MFIKPVQLWSLYLFLSLQISRLHDSSSIVLFCFASLWKRIMWTLFGKWPSHQEINRVNKLVFDCCLNLDIPVLICLTPKDSSFFIFPEIDFYFLALKTPVIDMELGCVFRDWLQCESACIVFNQWQHLIMFRVLLAKGYFCGLVF